MVAEEIVAPFKEIYPFRSHFLKLDSYSYHFLDEGEGDPLLMLHGNPTWSFYYRSLIRGLQHQNRCVVPDHMGCGLSDKPQNYPYTLETHIQNVETLVDHLSLDNITLVVHDWGGAIGMGFATRHPEKIKRLIIFNTAAFISNRIPWSIDICRNPLIGPFAIQGLNAFSRVALIRASKVSGRLAGKVSEGYLAPYKTPEDRIAQLRFVQDIPMTPDVKSYPVVQEIESSLGKFKNHPALIVWGLKDFCFTEHFLDRWKMILPNAEVQALKKAGHYVVEDAYEDIIPNMIRFLNKHPIDAK
ncbi:MAG: alpha/beta fold hydrolase [Candidatus Nitronauta litoralis]|uniref:Alpha/beta fold hydrolase n=1 Tax=Candidatus Nitronauta litoralis TaxID=2705533 RepID=A0A7T0BZ21_9BACT|nr:MAG: alpha/beta fold hydrolase [Candidatus Nitronauta litoralis]